MVNPLEPTSAVINSLFHFAADQLSIHDIDLSRATRSWFSMALQGLRPEMRVSLRKSIS